jgi:hypothetical protein
MVELNVLDLSPREIRSLLRNPNNRINDTLVGTAYVADKIGLDYFIPVPRKHRTYYGISAGAKYSKDSLIQSPAVRRYRENLGNQRILPDPIFDPVKFDSVSVSSKLGRGIPLSIFTNGDGAKTTLNHLKQGERKEIAKQFYCHVPLIQGFRSNKKFDKHSLTIAEGLIKPFADEEIVEGSVRDLQSKGRAVVYEILDSRGRVDPYKTFEVANYWKDNHLFQNMILHYDTLEPTRNIIRHGSFEHTVDPGDPQLIEIFKPYHAEIVVIMPIVDTFYKGDFKRQVQTDFNFNSYVTDGLMHFSYK